MAVEIAGVVHFISTMPGKRPRPFQTTISINGSCCMMDGPLSIPDSCAALDAVTTWALRRDSPSNDQGQPAATEPAQHDRRGPLGCADLLDAKPQIGEKP
jgi:hypothetical protein